MALDHVVLGLVAAGLPHGYAIWRRIDGALGGRATVQRSHVYGALAALQRRGLATAREERLPGRRRRRVFEPTPQGRAWLSAWLAREPRAATAVLRRALLVRIAVRALLDQRPTGREIGAERSARRRLTEPVTCREQLVRLLQERARRRLEVELWLLDRLDDPAPSEPMRPRPGSGSR